MCAKQDQDRNDKEYGMYALILNQLIRHNCLFGGKLNTGDVFEVQRFKHFLGVGINSNHVVFKGRFLAKQPKLILIVNIETKTYHRDKVESSFTFLLL
jgi:hypothetical protein